MTQPVYTSSSGTTVTDVTDQWVSEGFVVCVLKLSSGSRHEYVVATRSRGGHEDLRSDCGISSDGNLCDSQGSVIATPRPKLKKYRPFKDGAEFLQVTEGRPVWARYSYGKQCQLVIAVDESEVQTEDFVWSFAGMDSVQRITSTPHIEDSWKPFGVEE